MKTCYYELLEVSSVATESELKRAYRKKALQLHPDKNPNNLEEAHHQFSEIRTAYEVLSDPQERAWYDSHKSSILNDEDIVEEEDGGGGVSHIPSISTEEILRYFNPGMYTQVDDSVSGFYAIVSRVFERLAREEIQHGKYQGIEEFNKYKDDENNVYVINVEFLKYPLFGNSHSLNQDIREFYQVWSNFATCKTFNWKHEYRYSQAPDRRTRRLMERENKKIRDEARKQYNETVRKYVAFIKKRDPRYKIAMEELSKLQRKKQADDMVRQVRNLKRLEKLKANSEYEEQSWQKLNEEEEQDLNRIILEEYNEEALGSSFDDDDDDDDDDDVLTDSEFEEYESNPEEEIHEFECIVCDKILKNEQQFKIHEESKKHKKAVRQMKWEMRQEGIELGIDDDDNEGQNGDEFETAESEFEETSEDENELSESSGSSDAREENLMHKVEEVQENAKVLKSENRINGTTQAVESERATDESKNNLEEELAKLMVGSKLEDSDDDWNIGNNKKEKKKNKKKTKINNKSSRESTPSKQNTSTSRSACTSTSGMEKCTVCGQSFSSRNQLFNHVKSENHVAFSKPSIKSSKAKKKRK